MVDAVGDGRADRVLGDVAAGPFVVGGQFAAAVAEALLHHMGDLPGAADDLTDAAHGLGVGGGDGEGPYVVQDVLGRDGTGPDAGLGEGEVLGDARVEVVADHQHVEVFVDGVDGVRERRVGGRREDVGVRGDGDDVGRVATARALGVEDVDAASGDGVECALDVGRPR